MTCSPSCWASYGDLLSVQYSDPERMAFHQLVVDAYAVQHPDGDDPRAIQSVGIHLMTLCLFLEHGTHPSLGTRLHRRMVDRPVFHKLEPPPSRGRLTVLDVPLDGDPKIARMRYITGQMTRGRLGHSTIGPSETGSIKPVSS
ncbi:MAG: DUF5946 family protein [Mycobacteriales bacterium]